MGLEAPGHFKGYRDQQSSSEAVSSAMVGVRNTQWPLGAGELGVLPFLARVEMQTPLY